MTKRIVPIWILLVLTVFGVQISVAQGNTSPSGEIAFTSNRDGIYKIYLMNADGSNVHQLTHETTNTYAPIWSPDGQKLLYIRATDPPHYELMVMNADGSHPTLIVKNSVNHYRFSAWSPDSQWVIYAILGGNPPVLQFHRIKADGTDDQAFDLNAADTQQTVPFFRLSYFADGKRLLLATDSSSLYTTDADGSHIKPLTTMTGYPGQISPDGEHIVGIVSNNIIETDSKGNNPQALFSGLTDGSRVDFRIDHVDWLDWSPNGYYVWGIVSVFPAAGTETPDFQSQPMNQVFVGTARGDDYWFHVPAPDGGYLSWSPDSQWFAYTVLEGDNHDQIEISQPIGTNQMTLTSEGDNSQPAWRPTPSN